MKKIAFFGGSFNPPTIAHKYYAKKIIEDLYFDKVFFVPVGDKYKKNELIMAEKRHEMLLQMCKNDSNIEALDIEIKTNKEYKAIDIFKEIENEYIGNDIYFVMGADNFRNILDWKESVELITKYKYIILERDNINIEEFIKENELLNNNKEKFLCLKGDLENKVSSSYIRNKIKENDEESWKDYIDKSVLEYIKKEKLYYREECKNE